MSVAWVDSAGEPVEGTRRVLQGERWGRLASNGSVITLEKVYAEQQGNGEATDNFCLNGETIRVEPQAEGQASS